MTNRDEVRAQILAKLALARSKITRELQPERPPSESASGVSAWHACERGLWEIGEDVRQLFAACTALRKDPELQEQILSISVDRKALRGRQSFIMLLGYRACCAHAERLATELSDDDVAGHVLSTLYKMRAPGFALVVRPLLEHDRAWIRREAERYLAWSGEPTPPRPTPRPSGSDRKRKRLRDDWFGNSEWNDEIATEFDTRLRRARDKAQCLRIQACTLARSHPSVALELLDRYFALGGDTDLAQAFVDQATAYLELGKPEEAANAYERALRREAQVPNVLTQARLEFALLVATARMRGRYRRALEVLDERTDPRVRPVGDRLPVDVFRSNAAYALILAERGDPKAVSHAARALEAAAIETSAFRYHRKVGLVGDEHAELLKQLEAMTRRGG